MQIINSALGTILVDSTSLEYVLFPQISAWYTNMQSHFILLKFFIPPFNLQQCRTPARQLKASTIYVYVIRTGECGSIYQVDFMQHVKEVILIY